MALNAGQASAMHKTMSLVYKITIKLQGMLKIFVKEIFLSCGMEQRKNMTCVKKLRNFVTNFGYMSSFNWTVPSLNIVTWFEQSYIF